MSKIEVDAIDKQSGSTLTLGGSGTAVTLAAGATQSGFGRTGTVDWNTTPKTATFTAVSGDGFFANTTGSAFNMNLPAGSAGAIVSVADYAGTWQTNNLTVVPNGTDKIGGVNANVSLNTEGQSVTFLFVDSTQGWVNIQDSTSNERANAFVAATGGTETTSGDFKIHTFTGPGTFQVTDAGQPTGSNTIEYLVVAGGGAGGNDLGGGGGAGGYRSVYPVPSTGGLPVAVASYPVTVGAGGARASTPSIPGPTKGSNGSNSVFSGSSTITSTGGGAGGGSATPGPAEMSGSPGGSGGGSSGYAPNPTAGGTGNTPPVSPPQGNNGGAGGQPSPAYPSGGGGGSAAVGGTPPGSGVAAGSAGGAGTPNTIDGNSFSWAGGGGGAAYDPGPAAGNGGVGGGGGAGKCGGGSFPSTVGTGGAGLNPGANGSAGPAGVGGPPSAGGAGGTNTGGGGGGGAHNGTTGAIDGNAGGSGGSGIVIIRYKYQ
jgi:hypothetical protein